MTDNTKNIVEEELNRLSVTEVLNSCDISDKLSDSESNSESVSEKKQEVFNVYQKPQFSISSPDRKKGLTSITQNLKIRYFKRGKLQNFYNCFLTRLFQ